MPTAFLPMLHLLLAVQGEAPPETAPEEPAEDAGGPNFFLLMIALVAVFYFVMILPEKKNRKKREQMLGGMKKGDRVMTTSGLHGSIAMVQDDVVTLQVAEGVRLRFSRAAIQNVLTDDEGGDDKTKAAKPEGEKAAS
jgi:preprotein translocase subunit YajC